MKLAKAKRDLVRDLIFVVIGATVAFSLSRLGFIDWIVNLVGNAVVSSFLAGIFFTSVFSIAPSAVALSHIQGSVYVISFWGALGALCGDLILFYFIRDRFAEHLLRSFRPSFTRHILNSFHLGFMKWLAPIIGALIIASPLPDELALTLLGISKTKITILIPIAFIMNFIGIYLFKVLTYY
jgi:membrane protein DedA with SNARE-associated domain